MILYAVYDDRDGALVSTTYLTYEAAYARLLELQQQALPTEDRSGLYVSQAA